MVNVASLKENIYRKRLPIWKLLGQIVVMIDTNLILWMIKHWWLEMWVNLGRKILKGSHTSLQSMDLGAYTYTGSYSFLSLAILMQVISDNMWERMFGKYFAKFWWSYMCIISPKSSWCNLYAPLYN